MAAARGGNGVESSDEDGALLVAAGPAAGAGEEAGDATNCGASAGGDSAINEGGFAGCEHERGRKGGVEAAPSPALASVEDI